MVGAVKLLKEGLPQERRHSVTEEICCVVPWACHWKNVS